MNGTHRQAAGLGRGAWWARLSQALASFRSDVSFAAVDAFLVTVSYMAGLVLRFAELGGVPGHWWSNLLRALPILVVVHLLANMMTGAYGHVWIYASVAEAKRVITATASSTILLVGATLLLFERHPVPISALVLGGLFSLGGMGAVRFRSRLFSFQRGLSSGERIRTLIVGNGKRAADLARGAVDGDHSFEMVGFVSPHAHNAVRRLAGRPVLGRVKDLPRLIERLGIYQVIIACPEEVGVVRQVVDLCLSIDVRLRILPDLQALFSDRATPRDVRDLEVSDLLPRPTVSMDLEMVANVLRGKRVLVTGAGGSIGSEIVAQALSFSPARVLALDHDETHLHEAEPRWSAPPGTEIVPVLCDIRDQARLSRVMHDLEPEVVLHAAAHKHVPILERWPEEAVKTNVLGTAHLLEAARHSGVNLFVLISTDKAVNPTSVMGASKRVAEMLVQSAAGASDRCVYAAVRFGNVLGSRGSVVPTFLQQIQSGGPITVTDDRMVRYFMTAQEATELVLQASAIARGGEILVLDMGEPMRVVELAHRLIRLAGLIPGRDIEIRVSGIRPGEKLSETLSHGELTDSGHPKIKIADPNRPADDDLRDALEELTVLVAEGDSEGIRRVLFRLAGRDSDDEIRIDLRSWERVSQWR